MRLAGIAHLALASVPDRTNEPAIEEFIVHCENELGAKVVRTASTAKTEFLIRSSALDLWDIELLCAIIACGSFVLGLECNFVRNPRVSNYVHVLRSDWTDAVSSRLKHLARQACMIGTSRAAFRGRYNELAFDYATSFAVIQRTLNEVGAPCDFGSLLKQALTDKPVPTGRFALIEDSEGAPSVATQIPDAVNNFFYSMKMPLWDHYCIAAPNTEGFAVAPTTKKGP